MYANFLTQYQNFDHKSSEYVIRNLKRCAHFDSAQILVKQCFAYKSAVEFWIFQKLDYF